MSFPEFHQCQEWLEGNAFPHKQLLAGGGNAPGVTRAELWGPRDSKEGTQQKPPALRTHLFVQRGLLQWDGLLGLATFVKPKPLPGKKTKGTAAEGSQELSRLPAAPAGGSAVPGLCLSGPACRSATSSSATKGQTRNKEAPKPAPAFLTSEIGGSTMVSLRNFTITNFFRAIRFFL